jgi:hypothetical protein
MQIRRDPEPERCVFTIIAITLRKVTSNLRILE